MYQLQSDWFKPAGGHFSVLESADNCSAFKKLPRNPQCEKRILQALRETHKPWKLHGGRSKLVT